MKEVRYCRKCGSILTSTLGNRMDWVKTPNNLERFNPETGKKIDYSGTVYKCPNLKWFNVNHDYYFIQN